MTRPTVLVLVASSVLSASVLRAGGTGALWSQEPRQAPSNTFPEGPGREAAMRLCRDCHPVADVTKHRESRAKWAAILEKMIVEGASINDQDFETLVTYLSVSLGKKIRINEATAKVIEETFDFGPDESAAIIKRRTERGPFKTWKDVADVPGIDAKRVEEQKDNLDFSVGLAVSPA